MTSPHAAPGDWNRWQGDAYLALSDLGQETQRLRVEVVAEVNAGLAAVALPATPPGNRCNNLPFSRRSA